MDKRSAQKHGLHISAYGLFFMFLGIILTFTFNFFLKITNISIQVVCIGLIFGGFAKLIQGIIYMLFPNILIKEQIKITAEINESQSEKQFREQRRVKQNRLWVIVLFILIALSFTYIFFIA